MDYINKSQLIIIKVMLMCRHCYGTGHYMPKLRSNGGFYSMFQVLKKTQFPCKEAMDVCQQNPSWKCLIKK